MVRILGRGLALAVLMWVAACAEAYVDPPLLQQPVTPALAAYQVRHPGEVLFDRARRKGQLAALPLAVRTAMCGAPERQWPSFPVLKTVSTRADGGPDERSEPYALAVMREAGVAFGLDDAAARRALVRLLDRWARGGGFTRLDPAEANDYYAVNRSLLPTIVAFSLVQQAPELDRAQDDRIRAWLRHVARLMNELRPPRSAGDVTARNNHRFLSASVSMAWGALAGDDGYFREGIAAFEQALDEMRPDGSLPLETERGARALWYQRHAIASLVAIAEMAAVQGYDLYAEERDGRSLHAAIRFLLDAIDDPARVAPYARVNYKPGPDPDHDGQDLTFLAPRGHGRHYMAWTELYTARFPDRPESRRLLADLQQAEPHFRPMLDDYAGGNTTCFAGAPVSAP